jgi:hypothetical protein
MSIPDKNAWLKNKFINSTSDDKKILFNLLTSKDLQCLLSTTCTILKQNNEGYENTCYAYMLQQYVKDVCESCELVKEFVRVWNEKLPACDMTLFSRSRVESIFFAHISNENDYINVVIQRAKLIIDKETEVILSGVQKGVYIMQILMAPETIKRININFSYTKFIALVWDFVDDIGYKFMIIRYIIQYINNLKLEQIMLLVEMLPGRVIYTDSSEHYILHTKIFFLRLVLDNHKKGIDKNALQRYCELLEPEESDQLTNSELKILRQHNCLIIPTRHKNVRKVKTTVRTTDELIDMLDETVHVLPDEIIFEMMQENIHLVAPNCVRYLHSDDYKQKFLLCIKNSIQSHADLISVLNEIKDWVSEQVVLQVLIACAPHVKKDCLDYLTKTSNAKVVLDILENNDEPWYYHRSNITLSAKKGCKLMLQVMKERRVKSGDDIDNDNNNNNNNKCVVCLDNKKIICLEECGHVCWCATCILHVLNTYPLLCPLCRQLSKNFVMVYL